MTAHVSEADGGDALDEALEAEVAERLLELQGERLAVQLLLHDVKRLHAQVALQQEPLHRVDRILQ